MSYQANHLGALCNWRQIKQCMCHFSLLLLQVRVNIRYKTWRVKANGGKLYCTYKHSAIVAATVPCYIYKKAWSYQRLIRSRTSNDGQYHGQIKKTEWQTMIYKSLQRISNINPTKNWDWTQLSWKNKRFLFQMGQLLCYSC